MNQVKTQFSAVSVVGAVTGAALLSAGIGVGVAAPAQAMVCGYSIENERFESDYSFTVPLVNWTVDLFGGERRVAHWGNCSDANEQIRVTTQGGEETHCVTPGDSRLGFVDIGQKTRNAVKIGTC